MKTAICKLFAAVGLLKKVIHLTLPSHARRDARLTHGEAAGEKEPEAYLLGRTVRRIRSTTSVRAAE
jgi:hypothetical protein